MPFKLSAVLSIAAAVFKDRADLVAENVALRHQLACSVHRGHRPRLRPVDRFFWVLLSRFWSGWRESLAVVKPATVLAWHRKGFKLFWRWKSRKHGLTRKLRFLPPHPHRSSKADHPDDRNECQLGSSTYARTSESCLERIWINDEGQSKSHARARIYTPSRRGVVRNAG